MGPALGSALAQPVTRAILLACTAMTAFAANSVIARLALGEAQSDAGSFTMIRLMAGAVVLAALASRQSRPRTWIAAGSWVSSAMLVTYAAAFSYAYLSLGSGTGALVLFAAALRAGERPGLTAWSGLALAGVGLVALTGPGSAPNDRRGVLLMAVTGAAWAAYTLRGRGVQRPLEATASNFVRGVPLAALLGVPLLALHVPSLHLTAEGLALAVMSGALASGLGTSPGTRLCPGSPGSSRG